RFETDRFVTTDFRLYQNMPNPFKEETVIGFELPKASEVTLNVYDISGKLLTSVSDDFEKGYNQVSVDKSEIGTSGVFYYRLIAKGFEGTKKMIVLE
ncbi:MAG: hypothetical protein ACI85Q_002457, partial [Salibacteraceae bacterium]